MPDNEDSSRRDPNRPEDNPFIAFRRFADSQASALLNTVFTLPATIANYNNAHHAREQCLFGRADPDKCERLRDIETREATMRSQGRELYKAGDIQALLNKGEELMKLEQQADTIRKDIVEDARDRGADVGDAPGHTSRVERRCNDTGQHWGWSWNWGFPQPFDQDHFTSDEDKDRRRGRCGWRRRRAEDALESRQEELLRRQDEEWGEDYKKRLDAEQSHYDKHRNYSWSWSWSWPPPADAANQESRPNEDKFWQQIESLFSDMLREEEKIERARNGSYWPFTDASYSPATLENNDKLREAGVEWRDAFEDLVRAEQGAPLIPAEKRGQSKNMPLDQWVTRFFGPVSAVPSVPQKTTHNFKRVPWEGEETSEEPSYEYGHDHEDQHDDPPTPKMEQAKFESTHETELDAYERLLNPPSGSSESPKEGMPSVLSTLTTTERTVAPDGTVMTKVVLKKRFADGREESSETVHTQRGQDADPIAQDPWKAMQEAQFPKAPRQGDQEPAKNKPEKKRSGWFWSD